PAIRSEAKSRAAVACWASAGCRACFGQACVSDTHVIASIVTAINGVADRPCVGRRLIVFCANSAPSESFRDVPAIPQAVFICSLRMTARPICNHLSHGHTACLDAVIMRCADAILWLAWRTLKIRLPKYADLSRRTPREL